MFISVGKTMGTLPLCQTKLMISKAVKQRTSIRWPNLEWGYGSHCETPPPYVYTTLKRFDIFKISTLPQTYLECWLQEMSANPKDQYT